MQKHNKVYSSFLVLFLFTFTLTGCASFSGSDLLQKISVLQGPTSATETRFVVLRRDNEELKYVIQGDGFESSSVTLHKSYELKAQKAKLDHLLVSNLPKSSKYELVVKDERTGKILDRRQFFFLQDSKKLKIAVASCMDDEFVDIQRQIWPELLSQAPDALLMIGDNVYADKGTHVKLSSVSPEFLTQRYFETRRDLALFQSPVLIPTYAVWDDHDYGQNNGNKDFALKDQSKFIFDQFFFQDLKSENFHPGLGVGSWIQFQEADVFLLDNRYFRYPDENKNPEFGHFGKDQEEWLFKNLNPKKLTFLVSGDQWFGAYHRFESYEGKHLANLTRFTNKLKALNAKKIIFVSGDRHLTEIIKVSKSWLGYPTFELTSSGIHARMYPNAFKDSPSPHQWAGQAGEPNYMLLSLNPLSVQSVGLNKKVFFEKNLSLKH